MPPRIEAYSASSSSPNTNTATTSNPPPRENTLTLTPIPSQHSGAAALAPLQCMTSIPEKNVIEFLQPTEAQSLMLTCKGMQAAVVKFSWLKHEIAISPQMCGLEKLIVNIRCTDERIAQLSPSSQPKVDASPGALKRMLRAITPKAAEKKSTEPQVAGQNELRNQIQGKSALVDSLESEVESVAFHIASQRLKRKETSAPKPEYSRFHEAIYQGDVELVETALPIYLALPTRLMSHERKIEW